MSALHATAGAPSIRSAPGPGSDVGPGVGGRPLRDGGLRRALLGACAAGVVVGLVVGVLGLPAAPRADEAAGAVSSPVGGPTGAAAAPPGSPVPAGSPVPLAAGLGGPPASPLPPPDAARSKALAAAVAKARWRYGIPGLSVSIAFADGSVWNGHAGVTDVAKKTGVKTETAFAFGSVTKTLTAALVLKLVEEGRLGLDDPVIRWLPEYADDTFMGTTPARRQLVTVRMLLAQTSGLYDYFNSLPLDAKLRASRKRVWQPDEVLAYVKKPLFIAGDAWSYSNTNYLLLGLVAERAGGAPYATLLRTRLLEPAGLSALYLQVAETTKAPIAKGYDFASLSRTARPIPWSDGTRVMPFTSVTSAAGSAGAAAGTARDLARWGLALYGGTVLSPDSLARMLAFDGTAAPGAASDYGLGVGRRLVGDRLTVGHSGRLAGFRSSLRYVPELGVSVAVVTNQDRWDPDRVVEAVLDVLDPPAPEPSPSPSGSPAPSPTLPAGATPLPGDSYPPAATPPSP
jgi:D-alanyl-D-alanine carboxypeptidase